jgi:drug/metabolite transporter (DMT)-like permease
MGRCRAGALDQPAGHQIRLTAGVASSDTASPELPPAKISPVLSPRSLGVLALLVTAIGWGLGWLAMKVVLQVWTPLFSRGLAGVIAAVLLAVIAHQRGQRLSVPRQAISRLALAAFTNVFAWMGFSALCLKWLNVGEGVLLVFTMPIWATLFAWPLLGTRPTSRGFAALALGLAGVAVLLSANGLTFGEGKLLGITFALSAAVLFALGAVLNRQALPIPPIALTAWQVGLGCGPMVVIGLIFKRPNIAALNVTGAWAMSYMVTFPMAICYLTWFAALRRLPPAAASTSMLLVPLTGIISASLLLGEPLGMREMLAMTLTLGGVVLALRKS